MDARLESLVASWLALDQNPATRAEIEALHVARDAAALEDRLGTVLKFGTAGLRAAMGAGFSRMNDLTVIQASQGLAKYLEDVHGGFGFKVLIGYDGRHNSQRFARLAATAFLSQGAFVYLFSEMNPTPYVAYGTKLLGCAAGIMVTASHNPKEDNGYKVYWSNGAQINSPHDKEIAARIAKFSEPWTDAWNAEYFQDHPKHGDPFAVVHEAYCRDIVIHSHLPKEYKRDVTPVTYTAMHGVGYKFAKAAFERFGLPPFVPVPAQIHPDPDFPTVKYPNPEEGKGALKLSIEAAEAAGSRHIVANDPDADRLAVAEKQRDGAWRIFNGNEIAALFALWLWRSFKREHPAADVAKCCMLSTNVSSRILKAMADAEGFRYEETLTGFKWIGNRALDMVAEGYTVLFSFEEAIGFCVGSTNVDKDGLSSAAAMAELIQFQAAEVDICMVWCSRSCGAAQGKLLSDYLAEAYGLYGYHATYNSYYICRSPPTIERIFNEIRAAYPTHVGAHAVADVADLTVGFDSRASDHKAAFPKQSGQLITFFLAGGGVITFRTSGTEPKIKFYSELRAVVACVAEALNLALTPVAGPTRSRRPTPRGRRSWRPSCRRCCSRRRTASRPRRTDGADSRCAFSASRNATCARIPAYVPPPARAAPPAD